MSANSSTEKTQPALTGSYTRGDGRERDVVLGLSMTGAWSVYDVPSDRSSRQEWWLVETIGGETDNHSAAEGLASEYLADQHAYHAGGNPGYRDPLPHPLRRPAARVRQEIERAEQKIQPATPMAA
jgi:hypothetical protein